MSLGSQVYNSHLIGSLQIHRIGKKLAGRLLDHREWNEYPQSKISNLKSEIAEARA